MDSFEFTVKLKVQMDAFTVDDARDAITEALEDLPGATVTELIVDQGHEVE